MIDELATISDTEKEYIEQDAQKLLEALEEYDDE